MAPRAKKSDEVSIDVVRIDQQEAEFYIVGVTPLVLNRKSERTQQSLLLPSGRKTSAEKAAGVKHDVVREFRDSPYTLPDGPTFLAIKAVCFKKAVCGAALDIPGAKKAQLGRLVQVPGEYLPVWGIPRLKMDDVRTADISRTPDVRTRCALQRWATKVTVRFVTPMLKLPTIANMLSAAGVIQGIGDGRVEKGTCEYGQFKIVPGDDPEFADIVATGGRNVQVKAMAAAEPYDDLTATLFAWYLAETEKRGLRITEPAA